MEEGRRGERERQDGADQEIGALQACLTIARRLDIGHDRQQRHLRSHLDGACAVQTLVETLHQRQVAHAARASEHEPEHQDRQSIGLVGLFGHQRRFDQQEALALAVAFERLGQFGLQTLLADLAILGHGVVVVSREHAIFLLDPRRLGDAILIGAQFFLEFDAQGLERLDLDLRGIELGAQLDVGRVVGAGQARALVAHTAAGLIQFRLGVGDAASQ